MTLVFGTELHGARVRNALEGAAVLAIGAIGIVGAAGEATCIRTGSAGSVHALLRFRARRVEAGQQTIAVDTDLGVCAFEVELTAKWGRLRIFLEGVEAQAVVGAGRPDGAFVRILALGHAADGRADFVDRAVGFSEAHRPRGRRLGFAFVPLAEEAAALTQRTVGDADVTLVVSATGDPEQRDEENPEAFHGRFDAGPWGLFTAAKGLKAKQFR